MTERRWSWGAALLCLSCASAPTRYTQTSDSATSGCLRSPTCYTQPGDEAFLPWVRPAASVGAAMRVLETAEVARIEQLLVACAQEANLAVNEREYGVGRYPDDAECKRVVSRNSRGEPLTRQMELGTLKHAEAFRCVAREIRRLFPNEVSVEPRFGLDPGTGRYVPTAQWEGSMKPDIVLHASGQPHRVQCIYDFKFPCTLRSKENPLDAVHPQLRDYARLGGNCRPAIVTPQLGVLRE
jgi:hypothetical protein